MARAWHGLGLALLIGLAGCFPGYLANQKGANEGCYIPPIEGVEANGQVVRLADYKEKVILLSFWNGH